MRRYEKHKKCRYRKALSETNDCSVIATAIVCRTTYKVAHQTLFSHGRVNRKGVSNHVIRQAVKSRGFKVSMAQPDRQPNGSKYTPKTVGRRFNRGYYLVFVNGHVLAMVNGEVEDWSQNRRHHVNQVYKVVRPRLSC